MFMKKIMAVFVVALGMLMAQGVSAATLTWVGEPAGATIDANNSDVIGAHYWFTGSVTGVNHDWTFNVTPTSEVTSEFFVYIRNGSFVSAMLDSTAISTGVAVLLTAGTHTLHMLGITANNGTHEEITISAVNAVPVPGAVWLLGSALMGLVGVSRRKASANGLAA